MPKWHVIDALGRQHSIPEAIEQAFLSYFQNLQGTSLSFKPDLHLIIVIDLPPLSNEASNLLSTKVTNEEIKLSIFSMNKNSTRGLDGFNATFFTHCWSIISVDVLKAIHNYFKNCKMLGVINATNIALIPKFKTPNYVTDFRPIACCNLIYKCISKILATRLKAVLPDLISRNQAALLPRSILDNVFLSQELLQGYKRFQISPRAMIKLDIRKAIDII